MRKKLITKLSISVIVFSAILMRFYEINWDKACCMHPDERAIVLSILPLYFPDSIQSFFSAQSPLNPHFFAYGNLPLYLLKAFGEIGALFQPSLRTYEHINLIGRVISITADTGTVFLVYKIVQKITKREIAIASSFAYAFFVFPIQSAHFFTVDTLLTFFITLTLYRTVKFIKKSDVRNSILLALSFSLALATKISSVLVLFPILLAFLFLFSEVSRKKGHFLNLNFSKLPYTLLLGAVFLFTLILSGFFFQPYSFIDYKSFIERILYESRMTHDPYVFPYTLQYVGKIPYLYEIYNMFLWGIGPLFTVCFLLGIAILFKKGFGKITKSVFAILLFCIVYFLVVGNFSVGWMRYMLPLYPIISIPIGIGLYFCYSKIIQIRNDPVKIILVGTIVVFLTCWTFSFLSIYRGKNTRILASEWIHTSIPPGKILAIEHWDDRLPLFGQEQYTFLELPLYNIPDDANKWESINANLGKTDYIIIASSRLYKPLMKLADCKKYKVCYPKTAEYYRRLFDGTGEFKKIKEFTSYPTIPFLNIQISDQSADESFSVYDHPSIIIFQKSK